MKIKYVPLESAAFMTDPDFIAMDLSERGVYISLILSLYMNNGCLNMSENLHFLCGCSSEEFKNIFSKIAYKFRIKNSKIFHKKVSKVLAAQKKFMQVAYISGLKGGRPKKGTLNPPLTNSKRKRKRNEIVKENNINSNSKDKITDVSMQKENYQKNEIPESSISHSMRGQDARDTSIRGQDARDTNSISTNSLSRSSNSLRVEGVPPSCNSMRGQDARDTSAILYMEQNSPEHIEASKPRIALLKAAFIFHDKLNKILFAKTRSDRTCFKNIGQFLVDGCCSGKFNLEIFDRAIELAKEAKSGENPNALFMSLMRSQLGYSRK
ncbi:MAG: DUF1376 domain-containing protein [Sedimentisphaerales bacterium]|nr:DUF1376 domain-containing protein [Sedimentisphaerales bacterium]